MKRLTMDQLRELRVFNPYEFCGTQPYVSFYPHGDYAKSGWYLSKRDKPNTSGAWYDGNDYPLPLFGKVNGVGSANKNTVWLDCVNAQLESIGEKPVTEWIKFMGVYMPKDFYEKRMAELVKRYKESK